MNIKEKIIAAILRYNEHNWKDENTKYGIGARSVIKDVIAIIKEVNISDEPLKDIMDVTPNDKPLYYDDKKRMLYWISWEATGNNDIPHRHYLEIKMKE